MMRKSVQPEAGGLLYLTAQDVPDKTDQKDHSLAILGNRGDVVDLGIGVSAWNNNGGTRCQRVSYLHSDV